MVFISDVFVAIPSSFLLVPRPVFACACKSESNSFAAFLKPFPSSERRRVPDPIKADLQAQNRIASSISPVIRILAYRGMTPRFARGREYVSKGLGIGKFPITINKVFQGLDQLPEAMRYMQKETGAGKIVVEL